MHNFDIILDVAEPVTLFGGGDVTTQVVTECLNRAPHVIAADGGAHAALAAGHVPAAVIGDFDSISEADMAAIPPNRLFRVSAQDSTDFDKCLNRIKTPLVLAVGFMGARADHELAAFNTLVTSDQTVVLVGAHDVAVHLRAGMTYRFDLAEGQRVSLFPLRAVRGHSEGLRWPIDGLDFAPGGRIGTSNEATGVVQITMQGDGMIALLHFSALDQVIDALSAARG